VCRCLTALPLALTALAGALPASAQEQPPCDPAVPAAAELRGVRERVVYGATQRVWMKRSTAGPTVLEDHALEVPGVDETSRGPDSPPNPTRAAFHLPLDHRRAQVRLTLFERDRASGARCRRVIERTVRGSRRLWVYTKWPGLRSARRPRRIADGAFATDVRLPVLVRLRWRRWDRDVARARGSYLAMCDPIDCRRDRRALLRARVRISQPIRCPSGGGRYYYAQIDIAVGGRTQTWRHPCPESPTAGEG
jgi:hypothetical protein